jgi:hypothetical protein
MKSIIGISIVTATILMAGSEFTNMDNSDSFRIEIETLKQEVAKLKKASLNSSNKSSDNSKLEKKIKRLTKKLNKVKAHDAKDNIKWGVDFRTALDNIQYDMADGSTRENSDLYSNRLWLNMAYMPISNLVFKGQLSYNKAYGANMPDNGGSTFQRGFSSGFDTFDWVINEDLTDNLIKLRQAYWLYLGDNFLGTGLDWTASIGRRPSTTGFLSNLREDDNAQSPLGHLIDVEFDGASSKVKLEKLTGVSGMSFKLCLGQGSTNAVAKFDGNGDPASYAGASDVLEDIRLAGFIFTPYDDGQYKIKTTAYKAFNVPA